MILYRRHTLQLAVAMRIMVSKVLAVTGKALTKTDLRGDQINNMDLVQMERP
jgi:hypothetical protein